jgi:starch synthase
MRRNLRIVFVTPEISPLAKSGELADLSGSLTRTLADAGAEVSVYLPKYRKPEIDSLTASAVRTELTVPLGEDRVKVSVLSAVMGKVQVFLVDSPRHFLRESIYGSPKGPFLDNDERFVLFGRAVCEHMIKSRMKPDIIHCNNWPSSLVPVFMRTHYGRRVLFRNAVSVLTLHNAGYQGDFPPESLALTGLNWDFLNSEAAFFENRFNFLRSGVLYADAVNTVSRTYKKEILSGLHGGKLKEILNRRPRTFSAIRNGIDPVEWNPESDAYIAAGFKGSNLDGKAVCRRDLREELRLKNPESRRPLLGMVSYLAPQKGVDLIMESLGDMMAMDIGLVVLGVGEEKYEKFFRQAEIDYPGRVAIRFEPGTALTHKVIAGSDILLIPSIHEPCGLSAMFAMKYGTIPIVRATGGLKETVSPHDPKTGKGVGFVFEEFSRSAFMDAVRQAVRTFERQEEWRGIMNAAMDRNYSIRKTTGEYLKLYRKCLEILGGKIHVE